MRLGKRTTSGQVTICTFMRQAPLFWGKSHGQKISQFIVRDQKKKQLDPLKFGSHETTEPGCNFGQLEKASPR